MSTPGRTDPAATGRRPATDRALDVLLLFETAGPVLTAAEVARRLAIPRSTTYRYLQALRRYELVEAGGDGKGFMLGARVQRLARASRRGLRLPELALPDMRRLMAETGETVLLMQRLGADTVCVAHVESDQPVRAAFETGHVLAMPAGASAKVFLALARDSRTATAAQLRRQLDLTRARGYAISDGELGTDIVEIAAPVTDSSEVVAAISLAAVRFRAAAPVLPQLAAAVVSAARSVSERLAQGA